MKEIKFIKERQQFVYTKDDRRGPWLAARIEDLLNYGCLHAFWAERTFSEWGRSQPTCLFFTEDVLRSPEEYRLKDSSRCPDSTDFMKLPFEFEGRRGDCWVACTKINDGFKDEEIEELKKSMPLYFGDKPDTKLGFFDENLNESINRNFTTDDQIREIMENQNLSIEQKSTKLFDRSSHHVWMFAMCTYNYPQETLDYAEEHTGSTYDLRNANTRPIEEVGERYYIGGRTLMVLGRETEPFNLEESYEYYVLGRTEKYGRRTNDYPMEPLGWWKYIKACVEVYETAAGYKGKQLGFFDD